MKELPDYKHSKAYDEKEKVAINFADLVTHDAAGISEGVLEALGKHFPVTKLLR